MFQTTESGMLWVMKILKKTKTTELHEIDGKNTWRIKRVSDIRSTIFIPSNWHLFINTQCNSSNDAFLNTNLKRHIQIFQEVTVPGRKKILRCIPDNIMLEQPWSTPNSWS